MRRFSLQILLPLLGLCCVLPAQADLSLVTSGDSCAPVNVGKAIRTIQNFRGTIVNNTDVEEIAVSCPIVTELGTTLALLRVRAQNNTDAPQDFRCVLRQMDPDNELLMTVSNTVTIEPGAVGSPFDDLLDLLGAASRLNLTCLLPPQGALGLITITSLE